MIYKALIFILILSPSLSPAEDSGAAPPVSSVRAALSAARAAVGNNDQDTAVAELQKAADAGFTSVGVITGDPELSTLAGHAGYDTLVADMTRLAYPCEFDEQFKEFDFWLGKWDVHVTGGAHAGNNQITRDQRGCVLLEDWTSVSGGGGGSINYVDKVTGEWVQIWNDASGSQINIRGGMTAEGMLLTGTIHYVGTGQTKPFRGLWTALPDGRVRQFFEESSDGGATWATWFEGFYTRQELRNE